MVELSLVRRFPDGKPIKRGKASRIKGAFDCGGPHVANWYNSKAGHSIAGEFAMVGLDEDGNPLEEQEKNK